MKKALVCCVLTLAILILCETNVRRSVMHAVLSLLPDEQSEQTAQQVPSFSDQIGSSRKNDMIDVTLYYRYGDTQVLGAQRAQLDIRREETVASSIVQRLIDGPAVSHSHLTGLFPQGTEIISVSGEDTTAFVTLSRDFLGKPDGAPADWEDSFAWQEEAALRRRLAVQSVILALTDGGRYQRVQMYVADGDDDIPQRILMGYFDPCTTDASAVLAASPRDESALLTPGRALEMILDGWMARDYAAMYALLSPAPETDMPTLSVFEAWMKEQAIALLDYSATNGTISLDGQTATVVVDAQIRSSEGGDAQIVRESVPLVRVNDNWTMTQDVLTSLMIRD